MLSGKGVDNIRRERRMIGDTMPNYVAKNLLVRRVCWTSSVVVDVLLVYQLITKILLRCSPRALCLP